jgi:TP901 family phage tail tape measure protein
MAKPYEQDVILDVDGKPIYNAMDIVQRRIEQFSKTLRELNAQTVKDVKNIQTIVDGNIKALKQARSDLKALQEDRKQFGTKFDAVDKRQKQINDNALAIEKDFNARRLAEAKAFYGQDAVNHKASVKEKQAVEVEGAKIVSNINQRALAKDKSDDAARIASAREVAKARLEATQAAVKTRVGGITNLDDARRERELSATRLNSLRREREATAKNDTDAARGLATKIELEKSYTNQLDQTIKKLERQQGLAENRLGGLNQRSGVALARADVNASAAAIGAGATLRNVTAEQATLQAMLRQRTLSEEIRASTLARLAIVDKQVVAARALVTQEEKVAAAAARAAAAQSRSAAGTGAPPAPRANSLANILSPAYAGAALARTAVYGAAAAAAYGLFNTFQNGLQYVVQFEDELAKLAAIANATPTQMLELKGAILEIGSASRFSTVELTKVSQVLAQAGISSGSMADVLNSVTTLANASGSTPDEAVQLITSALGSFQLQGSEAARVADLMTSALNRTKLTVQQTGQAIQYVGATAFEQNISLEQLLATVGAVAQAGVKSGSTIGTGFRQFLVDLQTPSKKLTEQLELLNIKSSDVDVKVRGLPAVLDTLRTAGFGASQAYQGLETRAAAFYLTAKNNTDVMDQLQLAFANQGAAALANERAMNSLSAQWQRFKNIVGEGFGESLEPFLNLTKNAIEGISDLIEKQRELEATRATKQANGTGTWWEYDFGPNLEDALRRSLNVMGQILTFDQSGGIDSGFGNWIDNLTKSSSEYSASQDRLQTAVNVTTEKVEAQTNKMSELDKETQRLIVQKKDLIDNDLRSQAEIVTLGARFEGLSGFLRNTGNAYDDLTQAIKRYSFAQSGVLIEDVRGQTAAIRNQRIDANQTATSLRNEIQGKSGFSRLTPQEQAAVKGTVRGQSGLLGNAATRVERSDPSLATALNRLAVAVGVVSTATQQIKNNSNIVEDAVASRTGIGLSIKDYSNKIEASITKLGSLDGADKTREAALANTNIAGILNTLNERLKRTDLAPGTRAFIVRARGEFVSQQQQVKALTTPTSADKKEAASAAREARAAEREANKDRAATQADVDAVGKVLGLGLGSGQRTAAQQNALHAAGKTNATAETSGHSQAGGAARDFPTGNVSDAQGEAYAAAARKYFKDQGIPVFVKYENGKGKNNGTGPHVHVNLLKGARASKEGPNNAEQTAYDVERELAASGLALAQRDFKSNLTQLKKGASEELVLTTQKTLDELNKQLLDKGLLDLGKQGIANPEDPRFKERMAQIADEQQQNIEAYGEALADGLIKLTKGITDRAADQFKAAIQPAAAALDLAEAQSSGLGAASLEGKVPDYVKTLADKRIGAGKETLDRAKLSALPNQISQVQGALATARLSPALTGTDINSPGYAKAADEVRRLTEELAALQTQQSSLSAALGASAQIPITLTDGLNKAIEAYKATHEMNRTFSEELIYNMGGALEEVGGGLNTFFSDILTGSRSVLGAFGDFAGGMAKYLQQLAAQFVANKIFGLILNTLGGAIGGGGSGGGSAVAGLRAFNGGKNDPDSPHAIQGFISGGRVTNGSPLRDSVKATLAKDEWVINKSAVDSVGDDFMSDLNKRGSKAISGLRPNMQISGGGKLETNVYVVAPERAPALGPNDVLLTMHDDMLNGQSRKLIKQISRE